MDHPTSFNGDMCGGFSHSLGVGFSFSWQTHKKHLLTNGAIINEAAACQLLKDGKDLCFFSFRDFVALEFANVDAQNACTQKSWRALQEHCVIADLNVLAASHKCPPKHFHANVPSETCCRLVLQNLSCLLHMIFQNMLPEMITLIILIPTNQNHQTLLYKGS